MMISDKMLWTQVGGSTWGGFRGEDRGSRHPPPLENHVTIGFLSNTGTDPPQVAIEPFPIASGGRVV